MTNPIHFAINRISASRMPFAGYLAMCRRLGVSAIEIRNDLSHAETCDGTAPAAIQAAARQAGITIVSINALYPFDVFDAGLERKARAMAAYARDCGARALVMCPLNDRADPRTPGQRRRDLVRALRQLRPLLDGHGVQGLVEPLGFAECALRRKSDAVEAIYGAAGERHFRLVHDSFHHYLAGEDIFFPDLTGLVHVSGVEDHRLEDGQMRDGHRVLVGEGDRLGNIAQLRELLDRGYGGPVSFEPFAARITDADSNEALLRQSMDFIRHSLL